MTVGIDRDHFLDYSAKSKIFNLPKQIPVVKVRYALASEPLDGPAHADPSPSDPLVGDLYPRGKVTDQGFVARLFPDCLMVSGMGPELFDCD